MNNEYKWIIRKTLVSLFWLYTYVLCYAQDIKVQDTFLGCSYGISKKEALQHIKHLGLEVKSNNDDVLGIKYPSIGGIGFGFANMYFYNDSFYSIYFVIEEKQEDIRCGLLKSIKDKLEGKYQMKYIIEDAFFYQDGIHDVSLYQLSEQIILSYTNMEIRNYKEYQEL